LPCRYSETNCPCQWRRRVHRRRDPPPPRRQVRSRHYVPDVPAFYSQPPNFSSRQCLLPVFGGHDQRIVSRVLELSLDRLPIRQPDADRGAKSDAPDTGPVRLLCDGGDCEKQQTCSLAEASDHRALDIQRGTSARRVGKTGTVVEIRHAASQVYLRSDPHQPLPHGRGSVCPGFATEPRPSGSGWSLYVTVTTIRRTSAFQRAGLFDLAHRAHPTFSPQDLRVN
jgi:hypothetical protein